MIIFTVVIFALVIVAGILLFMAFGANTRVINTDSYRLEIDNSWHLDASSSSEFRITHPTGGVITAKIKRLDNGDLLKNNKEVADELFFSIERQNEDYIKISSQSTNIGTNKLEAIENMYESADSNSIVTIFKFDNNVVIFDYTANKAFFDILLNSVDIIKDSLLMKSETAQLTNNLDTIKTTGIKYNNNNKSYDKTINYELYHEQYHVNYTIPEQFKVSTYDSTAGYFNYNNSSTRINVYTKIIYSNIYNYITDDKYSIKDEERAIRDSRYNSSVIVDNDRINDEIATGFIYRISYKSSLSKSENNQKIFIIYGLDNIKTFIIEIDSSGDELPKNLVDNIRLIKFEKYGYNIDKTIVDGMYTGTLNISLPNSLSEKKYYEIKYKVPSKYSEIDRGQNMYQTRYFGLYHNSNDDSYKYNISVNLYNFVDINKCLDLYKAGREYNFTNGFLLNKKSDININGNKFEHYSSQNTSKSTKALVFDDIFLYELENGGYYTVQIYSDNANINQEIINDFAQLEVAQR